jgi:hypothetical protein
MTWQTAALIVSLAAGLCPRKVVASKTCPGTAGASSTDANIAANIERGFTNLAKREICDTYYW